jgi:lipid-A-disaccharide synthase
MKRILIVAGETSGDLHGASLMRAMNRADPALEFRGIGGDRMIAGGLRTIRNSRELNFMGFAEVIRHLPLIRRTLRDTESLLDAWKPHLAILIDYPGFNLKLAPAVKRRGIPLMYYISPQLWAWHRSRVNLIRRYVDRMVVLFEFEREFYRGFGIEADFVGHPLLDEVRPSVGHDEFRDETDSGNIPLVGFLPGSRVQEIKRILPAMAASLPLIERSLRKVRAVLGCAPDLDDSLYRPFIAGADIRPLRGRTYDIMSHADALVVASGTATLESAICGAPMVIVYKTSPLTFAIGKRLVRIPDIGLINVVAGSRIVPELRQGEAAPDAIAGEIVRIISNIPYRDAMKRSLAEAVRKLGEPGASGRAASIALEMIGPGDGAT